MFINISTPIFLCILIAIIIILFVKLKNINMYNVTIFMFLTLFWSIMAMMKKVSIPNSESMPIWGWALLFSSYQFAQVIFRLPLGKLSQKLKSRKIPILIATTSITISLLVIIATNFSIGSIIFGLIATGAFGATFGMQNQYWSENYDIRNVYWTVAIISIIPSFGALVGNISGNNINYNSNTAWWFLLSLSIFMSIISILYMLFPEKKDTIRLDNINSSTHHVVKEMTLRHVFKLSIQVVFVAFAFNILTTKVSYQDAISNYSTDTTTILTFSSIIIALLSAIYLARIFKVTTLIIVAHFILAIGILIGIIAEVMNNNSEIIRIIFLVIIIVGFTLFQNIMFGTMLHFDHKNKLLVLGIWLTIRSGAIGTGQFVGEYVLKGTNNVYLYLLIAALALVTVSFVFFMIVNVRDKKINHLFTIVNKYEYRKNVIKLVGK